MLEPVPHAMWALTVPKLLRPYFLQHRELLASTPRGAVMAFPGIRGVVTFLGVGGVVVWAYVWDDGNLDRARQKADGLAERLAARVSAAGRPPVEEASLSAL